jgi:hypothetical protein
MSDPNPDRHQNDADPEDCLDNWEEHREFTAFLETKDYLKAVELG